MEQIDSRLTVAAQTLTQTRSTQKTGSQDTGENKFQGILEEKTKAVTESTPKAAAKAEKKAVAQQPSAQSEKDPVLGELACAEMAVADAVVMLPEVQEADTSANELQAVTLTAELPQQVSTQAEPVQAQAEETRPVEQLEQPEEAQAQPEAEAADAVPTVPQTHEADKADSQTDRSADDLFADSDDSDATVTVTHGDAGADQPVFQHVEANMVKVGEAVPAERSEQTADMEQQIADQVTSGLEQGETKVEIKLTPSSLGSVTVEVTAEKDGTLHIALSAENPHTRALLEQHTGGLQDLVSSQAQRPVQVEVSQRQENQQHDLPNNDQSGRGGYPQQDERRQQQNRNSSEDFLQKLRLGLLPVDLEAVS
jgi:flagellar hook-length control protein FliK